jgi:hypothetical protein
MYRRRSRENHSQLRDSMICCIRSSTMLSIDYDYVLVQEDGGGLRPLYASDMSECLFFETWHQEADMSLETQASFRQAMELPDC